MDAEFRFVKPKEGQLVRFPGTMVVLPEDGAVVPWVGPEGRYWRRRVNDGDVYITQKKEKEVERKEVQGNLFKKGDDK